MYHHGVGKAVFPKGAMDFCGSRFFYDTGSILGHDASSGHNTKIVSSYATALPGIKLLGLCHQFLQ